MRTKKDACPLKELGLDIEGCSLEEINLRNVHDIGRTIPLFRSRNYRLGWEASAILACVNIRQNELLSRQNEQIISQNAAIIELLQNNS